MVDAKTNTDDTSFDILKTALEGTTTTVPLSLYPAVETLLLAKLASVAYRDKITVDTGKFVKAIKKELDASAKEMNMAKHTVSVAVERIEEETNKAVAQFTGMPFP